MWLSASCVEQGILLVLRKASSFLLKFSCQVVSSQGLGPPPFDEGGLEGGLQAPLEGGLKGRTLEGGLEGQAEAGAGGAGGGGGSEGSKASRGA